MRELPGAVTTGVTLLLPVGGALDVDAAGSTRGRLLLKSGGSTSAADRFDGAAGRNMGGGAMYCAQAVLAAARALPKSVDGFGGAA